jgi:hypothetical protein
MIQPVDDVPDGVPVISSRSDLKRIEQALRNNWEMPEQVFRSLPDQLVNIVTNGSPREQIAAASAGSYARTEHRSADKDRSTRARS